MKNSIKIIALILCFISVQAYSQLVTQNSHNLEGKVQQKCTLTPKDYKLWSNLMSHQISNNGDWYYYYSNNAYTKKRSMFVGSTKSDVNYNFPDVYFGQFSADNKWFGYLVQGRRLKLLDLEKGTTRCISEASKFEFSADGKYLIAYNVSNLLIMDLKTGKLQSIFGVTEYKIHAASNNLAYIEDNEGKESVVLQTLGTFPITTVVTENEKHPYKKLYWSQDGTALVFFQEAPDGTDKQKRFKLYYYNIKQVPSQLKCLDPTVNTALFQNMNITDSNLRISGDGVIVFFDVISKGNWESMIKSRLPDDGVQVWNTKDKRIYSEQKKQYSIGFGSWQVAWWPTNNRTMLLETKELPEVEFNTDGTYMLSYDPLAYAPHFKEHGDIDIYLTNLETGEQNLFLKQQEHEMFNVHFSPGGKYINYFRNKHWRIYDLEKKTHTNVTKGLGLQLNKTEHEGAHIRALPFKAGGKWTQGDKELVIHSQYDVWLVSPKGKAQRLTQGKEEQIRYRIYSPYSDPKIELNKSQGLVLTTLNTKTMASGYAIWNPKTGLKELVYKDMHVSELIKAKDGEAYIYLEESFDTPPRLRYWKKGMSDSKVLAESNPQQKQFQWGHSELIHYTGQDGQPLQGALFYPANYKTGKKYPMVVDIYEIKSEGLHHYKNPTEYLTNGFNHTNYTADGYIVFKPDIKYRFNDPGVSALQCVEAGVKVVLEKGIVEANHIGLIGNSFGGYETSFIMTQSNLFATAVAGSAITDVVSWYHTINWDKGKSETWRFEDHQFRFTDSFYKNPEAYFRNSPLHHAANINVPLLLWTGDKDYQVDWHQSIELYLGLRRLGKECTLLIYPNENHSISQRQNQMDITRRIKAWFDRYLKPDQASPEGSHYKKG